MLWPDTVLNVELIIDSTQEDFLAIMASLTILQDLMQHKVGAGV